jgi:hypothetical protein
LVVLQFSAEMNGRVGLLHSTAAKLIVTVMAGESNEYFEPCSQIRIRNYLHFALGIVSLIQLSD